MRRLLPVLGLALFVTSGALAQDGAEESQTRLQEIAVTVEKQLARLEELNGRQKKLASEQAALNKSIQELKRSLEAGKKKMADLEGERTAIEREASATDKQLFALRGMTIMRVRALAMQRKDRVFEQVLFKDSQESFARRAFLLKKIREHDSQLTRNLQKLFAEKRDHILVLKSLLDQQKKIEADAAQQQRSLMEKVAKLDQVKRGIAEEKKQGEQSVAELRAEALRLETVMVGLTGGESAPVEEEPEAGGESDRLQPSQTFYGGRGLKSMGHEAPVTGKVIQRYGNSAGKGFESLMKSKGMEISAPPGAVVRTIETGKVIFNGAMPGYGQIIIVDHGDREYSLYGRVASTSVKVGEVLEKGKEIARTGEPDEDGHNFYFEIRKNGKPLNPGLFVSSYK